MTQSHKNPGAGQISGSTTETIDCDPMLQQNVRNGSFWLDLVKRSIDVIGAGIGLLLAAPVLLVCAFMVWRQDGRSPVYMAERVGLGGQLFEMVKLRSMVVGADRSGVTATSACDPRITPLGHVLRRYKLDELPQLWNVLKGDMSIVGPRPQVLRDVQAYTREEMRLLSVRPGITDLASIVFADEGEILEGRTDPDLAYNQLIRPWKSRLGLFYVMRSSLILDLRLIGLTGLATLSRAGALQRVTRLLQRLGAPEDLVRVSARSEELQPAPPPGSDQVVASRY